MKSGVPRLQMADHLRERGTEQAPAPQPAIIP